MSDGPNDMARLERAEAAALPTGTDMLNAAARLDAATAALRTAVERHETMLTFAALLLKVAAPLAASVPGAPTAVQVATMALEMAASRRAS